MKKYRWNLLEKICSNIKRMEASGKAILGACEGGYPNCPACEHYINGGHQ